jgi:hypothetical protein
MTPQLEQGLELTQFSTYSKFEARQIRTEHCEGN